MDLSVVIPARNEHPQATFTLQAIWDQLEGSGLEWETILVGDSCEDKTVEFCRKRHWAAKRKHRVIEGEFNSCWRARNAGCQAAEGAVIFLFDAHVVVSRDLFAHQLATIKEHPSAAICYTPVIWMGDSRKHACYGYSVIPQMHNKFWGSWTRKRRSDEPYRVPMSGTAGIAVRRSFLEEIDGWPNAMTQYGGGEQYISMLAWMLGHECWIDPRTYLYHLADRRGYCWTNESIFFNASLVSYIIGGDKWWEHVLGLRLKRAAECYHPGFREIADRAKQAGWRRRNWVKHHCQFSLDEVLDGRPWEREC